MAIQGGYTGKLLDINLTKQTIGTAPLPSEHVLRKWVGGTGLGVYLLSKEITSNMRPTDPECPVLMLTGPLTGTLAPQSSHWCIVSLNSELKYHVGVSHGHGFWGARLKHAGWDGIIIRGISPNPVYLWIDDTNVELRNAARYWGAGTFDTVQRIRTDLGDPEHISVACIGPGGENLLPGGSVKADIYHACNRGGPGSIWGAKRLKAIAVRGTSQVGLADKAAFTELCEDWKQIINNHPEPPPTREAHGLRGMVRAGLKEGKIHGKNFTDPEFQVRWSQHLAEDLKQWKVTPVGSWECEMRCHNETIVTTGPMAGCKVMGYTGEVIEELGPNLGIEDPGVGLVLCGIIDDLGLDVSEVPRTISMVMEAYNAGILTREDTNGLDLTWGNHEAVIGLINMIVERDGIGAILAKGLREAARQLGTEDMAVHIKGTGFNPHDQRAYPMMLFQSLVASGAGPAWQAVNVLERDPDPDLGYPEPLDPDDPSGKGRATYKGQVKKMWEDTLGVCMFATQRGMKGILDLGPRVLAAAVGWKDFSRGEALLVGERIINLQRLFALFRGYEAKYDFDISKRMLEPVPGGPAKGRVLGPHLAGMRREYYECLNWDPETGIPRPEALEQVGLSDFQVGPE